MQRLAGKVAIVTGGGGGIGSATALRLAREGAKVVCADINLETAQRAADALEGNGLAMRFDAADADSIEAMVSQTVERFGRLDILHNNTAITDPQTHGQDLSLLEIPMEVWRKTLDVNLTGYMLACRFAIPHMIEAGGGSIINTASGSGTKGDLVRIAYGTSKAAIINMTRHIATPAMEATAPQILAFASKYVLTKRLGTPEDIAALTAFLASDESGYITGECIEINGGKNSCQPHFAELYQQTRQTSD